MIFRVFYPGHLANVDCINYAETVSELVSNPHFIYYVFDHSQYIFS